MMLPQQLRDALATLTECVNDDPSLLADLAANSRLFDDVAQIAEAVADLLIRDDRGEYDTGPSFDDANDQAEALAAIEAAGLQDQLDARIAAFVLDLGRFALGAGAADPAPESVVCLGTVAPNQSGEASW